MVTVWQSCEQLNTGSNNGKCWATFKIGGVTSPTNIIQTQEHKKTRGRDAIMHVVIASRPDPIMAHMKLNNAYTSKDHIRRVCCDHILKFYSPSRANGKSPLTVIMAGYGMW